MEKKVLGAFVKGVWLIGEAAKPGCGGCSTSWTKLNYY